MLNLLLAVAGGLKTAETHLLETLASVAHLVDAKLLCSGHCLFLMLMQHKFCPSQSRSPQLYTCVPMIEVWCSSHPQRHVCRCEHRSTHLYKCFCYIVLGAVSDSWLVLMQQALQQQAHEAYQSRLGAMHGFATHTTTQGYFGKTCL